MLKIGNELLLDREAFAAELAQTFEPADIVRLLNEMGLRYSDLALALGVHPRTIHAWLDESDPRDGDRQRDQIQSLKAAILFLLRRGVLTPRQLALWLAEPNERLEFRRPLAVFGDGDISETLSPLITAGAPFLHPEPEESAAPHPSVAAGAATRNRPDKAQPADAGERGEDSSARRRGPARPGRRTDPSKSL
ncbi:MAG TPA: hypothetical protein VHQ43_01890 [Solirubrobacterales bacterium]|jgi:transposase-like protein|nr:hypothetical protein [Solirubrobacterales bacterium]